MRVKRRKFLQFGLGAALVPTTGCDQLASLGLVAPGISDGGPFDVPTESSIDLVSHLINRLSFGPRPGDYARVAAMGPEAYIEEQLEPEAIDDRAAEWIVRRLETLSKTAGELFEYKEKFLLSELTRGTVLRAVYSRRQLDEVMVNFWTDHFNIDISKGDCRWLKVADDREVIRRNAMGNFADLVRASALSPAMLWYLDGRVNRKADADEKPNENYGRELLELHTLGVHGGYTQRDVMETARCLTGWTVRTGNSFSKGKVEFNPELHDDGEKTILGKTIPAGLGEEDLDRVLDIVTRHPSTARFISTKLCRRFIDEDPPENAIDATAAAFARSDGDIRETLRALFSTDEFRASRGNRLKRPFRFVVSALRATAAKTDARQPLLDYLTRMGHAPFQYPTPDGYPEEASPWMGTLMWRWHFAMALTENSIEGTKIEIRELGEKLGGDEKLMAHLLGRAPNETEIESYRASNAGPALMLASPGFQRC